MKVFKEHKHLTENKEKKKKKTNRIPLILTYNRTLPDVEKLTTNNWNLLQINKKFQDIFQQIPILPLEQMKTFRFKNMLNNRVQQTSKSTIGFSTMCFWKSENLCCKQVVHSSSFISNITKRTYNIF